MLKQKKYNDGRNLEGYGEDLEWAMEMGMVVEKAS